MRRLVPTFFFLVLAATIAGFLGATYIPRLSDHAGYWLVPVDDTVAAPLAHRPRRLVLVLVDGLRRDLAEGMRSTALLAKHGQCRITDQGPWTVSRPVYALLSTGVEVARSGARNNDLTTPLAAESVWEVARRAGLVVHGASHLPWFAELFPRGFDRYETMPEHDRDVFTAPLGDVSVYHPLYVDDAGHLFGGTSAEYRAAVARADLEIERLLAAVDLAQDDVILTADHGHLDVGGHGDTQPEVARVLTCFAGPNVARRQDRPTFGGGSIAATIAVLLGVPLPRHLRAGEDRLDEVWSVVDMPDDAAYVADRQAAIARFRAANEAALAGWLGGPPGTWTRLYARERAHREGRLFVAAIALVVGLAVRLRREPIRAWLWLGFALVALWAAHRLVLGPFLFSVINQKENYVPKAFTATFLAALLVMVAHRFTRRPFVADQTTLVGVLLYLNVVHPLVYGWPLGFPLPPPALRYLPFFACFAVVGNAAIGIVAAARAGRRFA